MCDFDYKDGEPVQPADKWFFIILFVAIGLSGLIGVGIKYWLTEAV